MYVFYKKKYEYDTHMFNVQVNNNVHCTYNMFRLHIHVFLLSNFMVNINMENTSCFTQLVVKVGDGRRKQCGKAVRAKCFA